jgi:hypothetical protein
MTSAGRLRQEFRSVTSLRTPKPAARRAKPTTPVVRFTHPLASAVQPTILCPCSGGCPQCTDVLQPKLTIGPVDDKYEREADRVADGITHLPVSSVQRQPT